MTKEELDKKLEELRSCFGALTVKPTLGDLMAFFKESFNKDIVKVGDRLVFDFTQLFFMAGNKGELYKRFKGKPIQPITVTYIRWWELLVLFLRNSDNFYYLLLPCISSLILASQRYNVFLK